MPFFKLNSLEENKTNKTIKLVEKVHFLTNIMQGEKNLTYEQGYFPFEQRRLGYSLGDPIYVSNSYDGEFKEASLNSLLKEGEDTFLLFGGGLGVVGNRFPHPILTNATSEDGIETAKRILEEYRKADNEYKSVGKRTPQVVFTIDLLLGFLTEQDKYLISLNDTWNKIKETTLELYIFAGFR